MAIEIRTKDDPRVSIFSNLKSFNRELLVADGARVVRMLLQSELEVDTVFCTPEELSELVPLLEKKRVNGDRVLVAERALMESIVGFRLHQGVMASARIRRPTNPPWIEGGPVLVLNGLSQAENVGAILRSCLAFGFRDVVFDRATASPFLRRSVRVSMGAVFSLRAHESDDLATTIDALSQNGYAVYCAETTEPAMPLESLSIGTHRVAVVIGSEGDGIEPRLLPLCRATIRIDHEPLVQSLNAGVAAGIVLQRIHALVRRLPGR